MQFPQRTAPLQRGFVGAHHRFGQFGVTGIAAKRVALEVIAQPEIRIILEGRMREVEWGENQTLPAAPQKMDASFEMLYQPLELDLALKGLKDTDVERTVRRLVV